MAERSDFEAAMDRLVALLPEAALQAETDPPGFIHSVADELERLRALAERAEDEGEGSGG